ncbi:hypothetical protein LUZ60_004459 [Juncus effusus]|nr:hypothetical protein LUZ60_004459 [Juncus effusus]
METSYTHGPKVFFFFRPFVSIFKHIKMIYKGEMFGKIHKKGYQKHKTESNEEKHEDLEESRSIEVPELSIEELINQTNNFDLNSSSLIGRGSNAKVFHAKLENGREIALKKLNLRPNSNISLSDVKFLNQLSIASRLKHENYIELVGYYVKDDLCLLAYEFAPMGSLYDILHGVKLGPVLTWQQRVRVALDIAKGLEYLHERKKPVIVHKNVRSCNILLFEGFRAKVADYDVFNEVVDVNVRPHSVNLLGTLGYTAPEYCMSGTMTKKSDVYSFGVVLLELLTGRKALDKNLPKNQRSLVTWAVPLLMEGKVKQCVDPKLNDDYPDEQVIKVGKVAAVCMQFEPELRPMMSVVVRNLETLI